MRGRGRRGRCWSRPFGLLWRQPTGGTNSQGTARGERAIVLLGRFSTAQAGDHGQVYFPQGTKQEVNEPDKGAAKETIVNQTAKETVLEISAGRRNRTPIGWRSANDRNWLSFFDRSHRPEPSRLLPALDGGRLTICPPHIDGSGTGKAVGSVGQSIRSTCGARASRKPRLLFRLSGVFLLRFAARQFPASLFQLPPRFTRCEALDRSPLTVVTHSGGNANCTAPRRA